MSRIVCCRWLYIVMVLTVFEVSFSEEINIYMKTEFDIYIEMGEMVNIEVVVVEMFVVIMMIFIYILMWITCGDGDMEIMMRIDIEM